MSPSPSYADYVTIRSHLEAAKALLEQNRRRLKESELKVNWLLAAMRRELGGHGPGHFARRGPFFAGSKAATALWVGAKLS